MTLERVAGSATDSTIRHIPKFPGELWFVRGGIGSDANDGKTPDTAFDTIGAAISASAAGDAITIEAATYTETGLDLNKDAVELWMEIGVIIDPATGTALTISGNSCLIKGVHKITPAAGEIGMLVSGDECHISQGRVVGGATCVSITGAGNILLGYAAGFPTATAFLLAGDQTWLERCSTAGNAATYGYRITSGADTGVLRECTSSGHTVSGFCIDAGSQDWTLLNCSSGAGDGPNADTDHANVWSNFSFDGDIHKVITFAGAPTTYNLFKVTGLVRIEDVYGSVETVIPNTACNIHLEVFSAGGTDDITASPGTDIDSAVEGAALVRVGPASVALTLANPTAGPVVIESPSFRDPKTAFDLVGDPGVDTYVRLVMSAALASGVIDFHCKWAPLSDGSRVQTA